jgi:WD40 repeat protein
LRHEIADIAEHFSHQDRLKPPDVIKSMQLRYGRFKLNGLSASLILFGLTLLIISLIGPSLIVNGTQLRVGASWWERVAVGAISCVSIAIGFLTSRQPATGLRTGNGFLGTPPSLPSRLVARPAYADAIVNELRKSNALVAVTGVGGAGKTTLAAAVCHDRRIRQLFREGITWLDASIARDSITLFEVVARRLGTPDASFSSIQHARDTVAAALAGRRVLVVLDDVWERRPIDDLRAVISPSSKVLYTTRIYDWAETFNADSVDVGKMSGDESLELLGRWIGSADIDRRSAHELCSEVKNLPLGIAMAGAMVAQGRSVSEVLAKLRTDMPNVKAELDPPYEYHSLDAAIEAGISYLREDQRRRYTELAVFGGHAPFPREAAEAIWAPAVSEDDSSELLSRFISLSLLTSAGSDWFTAHDVQFDLLRHRLGPEDIRKWHGKLLSAYRPRYPESWVGAVSHPYLSRTLTGHLHDAGRDAELRSLLTDITWITARLTSHQLADLFRDYRYTGNLLIREIVRALNLSAEVLAAHPMHCRGQLAGRLLGNPDARVRRWAQTVSAASLSAPWLAPLTPALTAPAAIRSPESIPSESASRQLFCVATAIGTRWAVMGYLDGRVRVWDLAGGTEQVFLTGHAGPVTAVALSPNGDTAVTGGIDGSVRVWDVASGSQQVVLTGHAGWIWSVAVTAGAKTVVSSGLDGSVSVWDVETGQRRTASTASVGWVWSVEASAGEAFAVIRRVDGSAYQLDLTSSNSSPQSAFNVHAFSVRRPSSSNLVTGLPREWQKIARQEGQEASDETAWVWSAAVMSSGTAAITAGYDGKLRIWRLKGQGRPTVISAGQDWVWSVAVTPDGRTCVSGGQDGLVRIWDLPRKRERAALAGHSQWVTSVAVASNGRAAISGSRDGTVCVWDTFARRHRFTLRGHTGGIVSACITPDGAVAVTGGQDGSIRVWDLTAGRLTGTLEGHEGWVTAVAVTPDGSTAFSGAQDELLRVWEVSSLRQRDVLAASHVTSVALTENGLLAVTGHQDCTVRVWDLERRSEMARWIGDNPIVSCSILPGDDVRIGVGQRNGRPYLLALRRSLDRLVGSGAIGSSLTLDTTR